MSIEAAAKEINGCVAGLTATKYRQSGNEYDVILSYQKADKSSIPDLEKIKVQGKNGLVSLANFASLKKNYGPVSINHENKARTIYNSFYVHRCAFDLSACRTDSFDNDNGGTCYAGWYCRKQRNCSC